MWLVLMCMSLLLLFAFLVVVSVAADVLVWSLCRSRCYHGWGLCVFVVVSIPVVVEVGVVGFVLVTSLLSRLVPEVLF